MAINKVAVLGSGVMGSGIAAHMANAGVPVVLLDIVPQGATNRNMLTEGAIEKQLKANPSGFTHKNKAKLVTCGNLEDNLDLLKDVDWIIEAVLEKLEVKQEVYRKIDAVRKKGSVVSSNTSTLPLHVLVKGMPDTFQQDFMITHFFNPPRFMHLLEMCPGAATRPDAYAEIKKFADIKLGKGVVDCKDTPGFIANRIGVFWMMVGLLEAMRLGISVEEADAVMGKPVGIPKTGIFGLFDLIGIDLMPLIAKAMLATLPPNDPFRALYQELDLIKKMIAEGYTGRKGKGGFTRINKDGGKKVKEVINLKTGEYAPEKKVELESIVGRGGLGALMIHPDIGGQYARAVLGKTLAYAASLIPEIANDIVAVDNTMKWGYNWKSGPFEMIDTLGVDNVIKALEAEKIPVPLLLAKTAGKKLYQVVDNKPAYLSTQGNYVAVPSTEGAWMLADKKLGAKPLFKNGSATLWDIGDGIACLEFTSKMNSVDPDILTATEKSIEIVKGGFKGLVIGNDADNFCVGANLGFILYAANMAAWPMISDIIKQGQRAVMGLKYAPFPVVTALGGMALGGGCEFVLHCDAVQAHSESYAGLVEVGVGVIPGWGGCKEMLLRQGLGVGGQGVAMPAIAKAFEYIATAKVAGSADEAKEMKILNDKSRITMNRARLLPDAKALCLSLVDGYTPPEPATLNLPGPTAKAALQMGLEQFVATGKATPYDVVVCTQLADVLSGGDTDIIDTLTEQQILDLEHMHFMQLIRTKGTLDRIEHMLATGKPLRN